MVLEEWEKVFVLGSKWRLDGVGEVKSALTNIDTSPVRPSKIWRAKDARALTAP